MTGSLELLSFSAATCVAAATLWWTVANRDREAAPEFAVFVGSLLVWNLFQIAELLGGQATAYYASFGIRATRGVMAVSWLLFTVTFAGYRDVLRRRHVQAVIALGAGYLVAFTGIPSLATAYTFDVARFTDSPLVTYTLGGATPYRLLTQTVGYAFVAVGTVTLGHRLLNTGYARRWQTGLFLVVTVGTLTFDLLLNRPVGRVPGIDYAALATTVVAATFVVTIYRSDLFGFVPVVRDHVVEHVDDAVVVLNPNRQIVDYNEAAESVCSTSIRVGEQGEAHLPAAVATHPLVDCFEEGRATVQIPGADGQRYFSVTASTVTVVGETTALVLILRDVTERERRAVDLRAKRRELSRKNERLQKFTGIVSHDLRNPLNVASGRLELARTDDDTDHYDTIARALDRMEEIIDESLTLAREGRVVADTEPVAVATLVEDCWAEVATRDATLQVSDEATVEADPARLKHVFENLFRNAVEHGSEDITVSVVFDDRAITVADDGPGIPAEEREDVFESGYSSAPEGAGFGLAIVREVVEAHGWEISVTEGRSGGTAFVITGVEWCDGPFRA